MIRKVYDIFVRTAIAVLLVLSLWLVIGAASKKDIGNLSDWVSSLSTFGTFIIAYVAFKKAPHWIKSKNNEIVHNKASEFFSEFMISYSKKIATFYYLIEPFSELPRILSVKTYYNSNIATQCLQNQLELIKETKELSSLLYEYIIYFNTYGWKFTTETNDKINTLYRLYITAEEQTKEYAKIYAAISEFKPMNDIEIDKFNNGVNELNRIHKVMYEDLSKCNKVILDIFRSGKTPESYFCTFNDN